MDILGQSEFPSNAAPVTTGHRAVSVQKGKSMSEKTWYEFDSIR